MRNCGKPSDGYGGFCAEDAGENCVYSAKLAIEIKGVSPGFFIEMFADVGVRAYSFLEA